jgi:hypothetical protein
MQFHYVVGYNSETGKWFVENDTFAYFPDGNVFYPERAEDPEWGWNGWFAADEGTDEALDYELFHTLQSMVDVIPVPQLENANG